MSHVILILSDGLRDDTAAGYMGYLEHLVEARRATRYTVRAELPTVSRVLYETIHTGVVSSQHGITANSVARLSRMPNVFGLAREQGLTTAAAASHWFSELYNRYPFDLIEDCEVDDPALAIQHGRFYTQDSFPDWDLFGLAAALARKHSPHYLLIHPMSMDFTGETYGADSPQYRNQAQAQGEIIGRFVPGWLAEGYTVLVTADHGLNADHSHGGTLPDVRRVPLYVLRPDQDGLGDTGRTVSQLQIAPTLCQLLGLTPPETMKHPPIE
jgi:hypothetical protein